MKIEDYGLIGDTHTAALVGRDGTIDWLCLPRFDSGACFAAILGEEENGRWKLGPTGDVTTTRRRYRDGSLILETEFDTDGGSVRLIDFMPVRAAHDGPPSLVRLIEGLRGSVEMRFDLVLRFDYGRTIPWVQRHGNGVRAIAGPNAIHLHSSVKLHGEDFHTVGTFTVSEGERHAFELIWYSPLEKPPRQRDVTRELSATQRWWHDWISQLEYEGPWRDTVARSLMVLKALTYSPSGGIVAAPTTSLPEWPGGSRNWDYRYCWLRDATFTLYSLLLSGYTGEAKAWRDWLLRAVAGEPHDLQIAYGIAGERILPEIEIEWLPGYEQSAPVRVGNAACKQLQLDVFGEVMDVMHVDRQHELPADPEAWNMQRAILDAVEDLWQQPDNGIWEVRGPQRHFTHSKVMAWVAFDRAIQGVEQHGLDGPVDHWRELRQQIHDDVCTNGYDAERNTFTQFYGSTTLDAALLMMPIVGFLPPDDPRMVGTIEAIEKDLLQDGFVHRYDPLSTDDGVQEQEGVFLPCTFWLADCLAMIGRYDDARAIFERLLGICNDLGLISEEYDPGSKRLLGNFPQAFTHVALVNTAHNLTFNRHPARERSGQESSPGPKKPVPAGERSGPSG